MSRKETAADRSVQIARIAWLATFIVPLVLSALLLAVKAAPAATPGTIASLAFEEEPELEEEGEYEFEEACPEAEEELEAGELGEVEVEEICEETEGESRKKGARSGSAAPEECVLRSATPHAHTNRKRTKLKLTVGYTTYEPANATIELRTGGVKLGSVKRHLGRSGVLRITKKLAKKPGGKRLVVRIRIPGSPRSCAKFQTETIALH